MGCVKVRERSNRPHRRSTWAKNSKNHRFLTVFQLLRSRTLTHPNEIKTVYGHALARLPRKISAGSAHRGASSRPRRRSTWINWPKTAKIIGFFLLHFEPLFTDPNINLQMSIWYQKNSTPLAVQHVEGFHHTSTLVKDNGGVKCDTNRESPCRYRHSN